MKTKTKKAKTKPESKTDLVDTMTESMVGGLTRMFQAVVDECQEHSKAHAGDQPSADHVSSIISRYAS